MTDFAPSIRPLLRDAEYAALRSNCEAISNAGHPFTVFTGTVCRIIERSCASVWVVAFDDSVGYQLGKAVVYRTQLLPLCFSPDEVDEIEEIPWFDPNGANGR